MNKIQDNNQSKDFSARKSKEFWNIRNKKSDFISIFIIMLIALAVILIFTKDSHLFFIVFLVFEFCYLIFILIPLIWILIKITVRTKNFDFGFQTFVYSQFLMYMFIASVKFSPFFENQPINIEILINLIFYIMPLMIIVQTRLFRKSIFRNDSLSIDNASLILRQSIQIEEELNGFSQRPIFTQFQELEELISSPTEFKTQFEKHCAFIGKKGELIDWDVTEDRAILYPRVLIRFPNIIKSPLRFIKFMKTVRSKTDLTTIEISYPTKQMFIKIAFSDYDILNREVTFHNLTLSILETVKISLIAFFSNDLESAYSLLIDMSE